MTGYLRKNAALIIILGFSIVLGGVYSAEAASQTISLSGTFWDVHGTSSFAYGFPVPGKPIITNQIGLMTFGAGGDFYGDVFTGTWIQQGNNYTLYVETSVIDVITNLLSGMGITETNVTIKKITVGGTVSVTQTSVGITLNALVEGEVDVNGDPFPEYFKEILTLSGTPPLPGSAFYGLINPAITAGTPSCGQFDSDPVNCNSGNLVATVTDISVPGRGRALNLTRTYNSLYAASGGAGMFGPGWTSSYDESLTIGSNAVTVRQAGGATVTFIPTNPGFGAPSYVTATLVQNKNGTYTFTLKNQQSDTFDKTGRLISQTDRNGLVTTLTYDPASGNLTKVTDPANRSLVFTTGSNGLVSSVTDPIGRTVSYQYDASGNLSTVTDVGGNVTTYGYSSGSEHLLVTTQDPLGFTVSNQYDGSNRVTTQLDQLGNKTSFSYGTDSYGNPMTTVTDPNGNVSVRTFSPTNSQIISFTMGYGTPSAATWTNTYDSSFNRISVTDANGNTWKAAYDSKGNPTKKIDPLGNTVTTTYTSLNDPATITDQLGVKTTFTYTSHGDLASISRPMSAKTTLAYGDSKHPGDITSIKDPTGAKTTLAYDTYGNTVSITDPDGGKTTRTFDIIGRMLTSVSPLGNVSTATPGSYTTSYEYDAFGKVTSVTDPLDHTATNAYDKKEELTTFTDRDGNVTSYDYSPTGKIVKTVRGDGSTISNTYDANGNLVSRTDGNGNTTSFTYDPLDRLSGVTDALSRTTTYVYDKNGNRLTDTAPDQETVSRTYDPAGRLTGVTYSDVQTHAVTYKYDKTGRRIGMTDGSGTSTWQYDSLGRLTKAVNGAGQKVSYAYDLRGLPTGITYPNINKSISRVYDKAGRVSYVKDWLKNTTSFQYDADGNLLGMTYPNGVTGQYQYDENDRVTGIDYKKGNSDLISLSYTRTNAGLLASDSGTSTSYLYDGVLRLVDVSNKVAYAYDAADRITAMPAGVTLAYDYADQLSTGNGGAFSYDERANRVKFTPNVGLILTYTYDGANRLTGYEAAATSYTYAYDGDGLRVSKTTGGTAEAYVWDRQAKLPAILADGSSYYVYGPGGMPLEQVSASGAVLFYHADQLGSIRMITDSEGTSAATYTYDVYGNLVSSTNPGQVANPFGYAGAYTDAESGLLYLRARYYDPSTAQFITKDPLFATTRQAYAYANDSPTNFVDPFGLHCGPRPTDWVFPSDNPGHYHPPSSYSLYQEEAFVMAVGGIAGTFIATVATFILLALGL